VQKQAISVVIPTYDRRERLARVIEALTLQSAKADAFEVIIVDDGSADGTGDWLERQALPYELRVLRQANQGPAAARNRGVSAARSPLVLFLDDDVVPGPELVREHLVFHRAEPDAVVLGPLLSLPRYRQPWVAWEQAKLDAQYKAMIRGDWAPTFRQFWTGNASVAKEHVVGAGGFDVSLLRGEDVELGYRLWTRGLKFRFNPAAGGLHHAERSLESWSNAHKCYGRLEVQIFRRKSEALVPLLAENWSRLHPLNRLFVRQCVGRRFPFAAATSILRSCLRLAQIVPAPPLSEKACGALANLLYWDASADELGGTAIREVFRQGGRLARAA
jgi:glycosyltransferase involved in cell wall biosynthesis